MIRSFFKAFDSRQFQLECLLEEDEDKSLILTPEDMQDKGRHSYNKDMGKMDMTVQTSFTENPTDTPRYFSNMLFFMVKMEYPL